MMCSLIANSIIVVGTYNQVFVFPMVCACTVYALC